MGLVASVWPSPSSLPSREPSSPSSTWQTRHRCVTPNELQLRRLNSREGKNGDVREFTDHVKELCIRIIYTCVVFIRGLSQISLFSCLHSGARGLLLLHWPCLLFISLTRLSFQGQAELNVHVSSLHTSERESLGETTDSISRALSVHRFDIQSAHSPPLV